jgi:hypothetical protein
MVDAVWSLVVRIKYPKLALLGLTGVLAFLMFRDQSVQSFFHSLGDLGYLSAYLGGMLFAFGFGAPFGVAILLTIADDLNILVAALVGGLGALTTDYIIFKFIRLTFDDEITRFRGSNGFSLFRRLVLDRMPPKIRYYFAVGVAGLVISSPLPDEIGVAILASIATIRERTFAVISFSLNTLGVLVMLEAGTLG